MSRRRIQHLMFESNREKREYCANGKVSYDKKAAQTAKNRRWNEEHVELRIYQCPECNLWHLTSDLRDKRL